MVLLACLIPAWGASHPIRRPFFANYYEIFRNDVRFFSRIHTVVRSVTVGVGEGERPAQAN